MPPVFQISACLAPPSLSRSKFLLMMPSMGLPITIPPLLSLDSASSSSSLRLIVCSSSSLAHPSSSRRTPWKTYLLISFKCTLWLALPGHCCIGGVGWTCTVSWSPFHLCQPIKIADTDAHNHDDIDHFRGALISSPAPSGISAAPPPLSLLPPSSSLSSSMGLLP
jgi:hypothetical protein